MMPQRINLQNIQTAYSVQYPKKKKKKLIVLMVKLLST